MSDPFAQRDDAGPGDQTIPLVPEAGYAQPAQRPFAEETLLDPLGPADPWATGPGLRPGSSPDVTVTQPIDVAGSRAGRTPAAPQPDSAPSARPAPVASYQQPPFPGEQPAYPGPRSSYPNPAQYSNQSPYPNQAPYPSRSSHPNQPAPYASRPYQRPPYANPYAEPNGPAATIGTYAGQQQWPAVADPVAYDYGYGYSPGSPHPNAASSLVLGILGLTVFSPLAPVAWYLAAKGRRQMAADPYRWQPSGMLTAGLVLGIIGTLLLALVVLGIAFFVMLVALRA